MVALTTRYRFSVEDYHRMADSGILATDDRLELINGEIISMSPIGSRHIAVVNHLTQYLVSMCKAKALVQVQNPILLGDHSEPEPDLSVVKPRDDYYASGLPTASDTLLVIEVADATLEYDRQIKLPLYARHSIAEAWLVDLVTNRVEVHRQPTREGYEQMQRFEGDQVVVSQSFEEIQLTADSILLR